MNGISIFRKSAQRQPSTEALVLHAEVHLEEETNVGIPICISKGAVLRDQGLAGCRRRLRVTVLRASECNGTGQEDGAINNSPTERGFVTARALFAAAVLTFV